MVMQWHHDVDFNQFVLLHLCMCTLYGSISCWIHSSCATRACIHARSTPR